MRLFGLALFALAMDAVRFATCELRRTVLGSWLGSWLCWEEAALKAKWDSAQVLCAEVASKRADFGSLASGLSTSAFRQLKLDVARSEPQRGA
eukprot:1071475-Amphidinium_carterae.1